jgi:hypothetical protein
MSDHVYKLIYLRDDTTGSGLACGEGAAYDLATATRLIATGVCRIDESEPEREALEVAVKAYKRAPRNKDWELPLVGTAEDANREWIQL